MAVTVKLELQFDNERFPPVVKACLGNPEDRVNLVPHPFNRSMVNVETGNPHGDEFYLILCCEDGVHGEEEFVAAGFLILTIERWQRYGGYVIGILPGFRRKGIARAAIDELLAHCFDRLGLNKVGTCVLDFNEASFRLHDELFVHEGTLRQVAYINGKYHDEHHFGLLADEWRARRSAPCQPDS